MDPNQNFNLGNPTPIVNPVSTFSPPEPPQPEPVASPNPIPEPVLETPSSKSSGFLKTFFIIIALILFGVLVGVIAARYLPMTETTIAPTPTITIEPTESLTPTPTIDETVGWESYTNTQYFYSIKFPQGWLKKSFGPGVGGLQPLNTSSSGVILSSNNQETTAPNPMLEIQAEGPENLSRPTYVEWSKQIKTSFNEGYKLTKESTSIISGITAIVLEGERVYPNTSTYIKQLIFASSEKGVYFTITIASDTKQESIIFDQILSTFKFSGIDETANWETYNNTTANYSIKYPNTFLRLICPNEELTLIERVNDNRPGPIDMSSCDRGGRYAIETKTYESIQMEPEKNEYYTITKKDITLGELPAKQYIFSLTKIEVGPYPEWYTLARVNKGGKTYEVYLGGKEYEKVFDQILSTFRFTN